MSEWMWNTGRIIQTNIYLSCSKAWQFAYWQQWRYELDSWSCHVFLCTLRKLADGLLQSTVFLCLFITSNTYTNHLIFMYCRKQYIVANCIADCHNCCLAFCRWLTVFYYIKQNFYLIMSISFIIQNLLLPFLGAFSKLRTAIISFVMPFHLSFCTTVLLSVFPQKKTRLPLCGFS